MSLARYGVPLNGSNLGMLQPKQKYRFRVIWTNFGLGTGLREMTANVVSCTRPKISHEEIKLDSYNSVVWIQGKHSLETIEIKLRDDITNSIVSTIGGQIQKQMNHYEQTSAVAGNNYKFSMEIHSLDGTKAEELESWVLEGCWIKDVAYGDGDYASGESQDVTLTIRFDLAVQVAGPNTNLGTTVGGSPFPNNASPRGGTSSTD